MEHVDYDSQKRHNYYDGNKIKNSMVKPIIRNHENIQKTSYYIGKSTNYIRY